MHKKIYILLLIMMGFLLTPSLTYACGKSAHDKKKTCCNSDSKANAEKKDCCAKEKASKHKCGDGCDGNCKNMSCNCSMARTNVLFPSPISMQCHYLAGIAKQSFTDAGSYTLSGFASIWLPPKIS